MSETQGQAVEPPDCLPTVPALRELTPRQHRALARLLRRRLAGRGGGGRLPVAAGAGAPAPVAPVPRRSPGRGRGAAAVHPREWAESPGIAPETLSRLLRQLEAEGVLSPAAALDHPP